MAALNLAVVTVDLEPIWIVTAGVGVGTCTRWRVVADGARVNVQITIIAMR